MSRPLNPSTATRAQYTASYTSLSPPPPPLAHPKWARLWTAIKTLFKAIGEDESMTRNNLQTFDTPATDKNAQYFAWDFAMRTIVSSSHQIHIAQTRADQSISMHPVPNQSPKQSNKAPTDQWDNNSTH